MVRRRRFFRVMADGGDGAVDDGDGGRVAVDGRWCDVGVDARRVVWGILRLDAMKSIGMTNITSLVSSRR